MPVLLMLLGMAALLAVANKSKAGTPTGRTFELDANMHESLRNQVLAALMSENDPRQLESFAAALDGAHPVAAAQLRRKAAALRSGAAVPAPVPQPTPQAPVGSGNPWDMSALPEPLRSQIEEVLRTETNADVLEEIARGLEAGYPHAAAALRMKAVMARAGALPGGRVAPAAVAAPPPAAAPVPMPVPVVAPAPVVVAPTPPPRPATATPGGAETPRVHGFDVGMPPEVAQAVLMALTTETDAAKLRGFAASLQQQYPIAAALLNARADALGAPAPTIPLGIPAAPLPTAPPVTAAPAPKPQAPAPAPTPVTEPAYRGLDPNIPPDVAQAVAIAMATETDPAKLRGFAASLAPKYPLAAAILEGKANTLAAVAAATAPRSAPPAPAPAPRPAPAVVTTSVSQVPQAAGGKYTVKKGDSPWKIAQAITGKGARWPELVAANPQKKRAQDGSFASLLPGEQLNLPASWTHGGANAAIA
jgi:hypothetical protein